MQRSRDTLASRYYTDARALYEQALALDPRSTAAMLGLAWVANSDHDFPAGDRWCRTALAIDPDLPEAYALLSDAAVEAGDYRKALTWCQRGLDLRPDLASYSRAAHVSWLIGQPEQAIALMTAALAAGGPHAENIAWCEAQLALMLFRSGDAEAAFARMERAVTRHPGDPHVLAAGARIAASRGDVVRALALGRRAEDARESPEGLMLLVDVLSAAGQPEEAQRQVDRILAEHAEEHAALRADPASSLDPAAFVGDIELARFLADHGLELDRAVGEAEAAWAVTPNFEAADTLAWVYHRVGRNAEAVEILAQAMQWNPADPEFHFHAANVYASLNETEKARTALQRALNLNAQFHPRFAAQAREMLRALGNESG
jgi:tetratricopeptide (TPR) repeat protein